MECGSKTCPWDIDKRDILEVFWNTYRSITCEHYLQSSESASLGSHGDLLRLIKDMKAHPEWTRKELTTKHFANHDAQMNQVLVDMDRSRAVTLAASVVFMVDFGYKRSYTNKLAPFEWRSNVKVEDLIGRVFPQNPGPPMASSRHAPLEQDIRSVFSAANLQDRIPELRFETTNDLRCHLRFNKYTRILQIFQATSVMKQILLASQSDSEACLIPRQLAVEVCDTIYNMLFYDKKSRTVLEGLIRNHGFKDDLKEYDSACHQLDTEVDEDFPYFSLRLKVLLQEMEDPSPANWFERLFDSGERSAERRMLIMTMIGVAITAISSTLNLIVASYLAYVGYQAWQASTKEQ